MTAKILFEHPLNEKTRTLLRLSHLFEQLDYHLPQDNEWNSRAAMSSMLDIATILARSDIKSDLLKEMDRYSISLGSMTGRPGVDSVRLNRILEDIGLTKQGLKNIEGQLGHELRSNDFLKSIIQRSSIPGGSFDYDLPQYHYWLQLSHTERMIQLDDWRHDIAPVQDGVNLLLALIRNSATPKPEIADGGFFQRNLDTQLSSKLLRVRVEKDLNLFAEISGGKHRFTIRFMQTDDLEHPKQTSDSINFDLTICAI